MNLEKLFIEKKLGKVICARAFEGMRQGDAAYFTLKDFLDWEDNCLPEKDKLDADALLDWWRENIFALVKELKKEVHLNAFEIEVVYHPSGMEAIRFREAPHGYRADRPAWADILYLSIVVAAVMALAIAVSAGLAIVIGVL